jgi:hypothetical protein
VCVCEEALRVVVVCGLGRTGGKGNRESEKGRSGGCAQCRTASWAPAAAPERGWPVALASPSATLAGFEVSLPTSFSAVPESFSPTVGLWGTAAECEPVVLREGRGRRRSGSALGQKGQKEK